MLKKIGSYIKENIRMIILYLMSVIMIIFLLDVGRAFFNIKKEDDTQFFTKEELAALQPFAGQTLKIGMTRGQELSRSNAISELLLLEQDINIEFKEYETYEELTEAVTNGEVDAIVHLLNDEPTEGLHWISTFVPNIQFVITNRRNPLIHEIKLAESHVGFIKGSRLNQDYQETIGNNHFETTLFDSLEEGLDAIENQEIDAFMTRLDQGLEDLIKREDLQIEFTFQSSLLSAKFATANEEVYPLLLVFDQLFNSARAGYVSAKLHLIETQNILNIISDYIQAKYWDIIGNDVTIQVGMHYANFPYSFFDQNGNPSGIYHEILDFLEATTGMKYQIQNSNEDLNIDQLVKELENNDIQFLLGLGEVINNDFITKIDMPGIQDNVISIQRHGNDTELRGLSGLKFGIVLHQQLKQFTTGIVNEVEFENYDAAIEALLSNEIDILLLRESVLSYYRDVIGINNLSQTNHINRLSSHGIIGNVSNERLNGLLADILKLYPLVDRGEQGVRWDNQLLQFQESRLNQRNPRDNIIRLVIGLCGIMTIFWIFKKEKQTKSLKKANERDPLTGLYNKRTYEKKCQELIAAHPNLLGVFFFIDLDNFKNVNDAYGHEVGDRVLIKFSEHLKKLAAKTPNTVCFRIAGDEFGVFSMGYQSRDAITHLVVYMRQNLEGQVMGDATHAVSIKFSAGGSIYNLDTVSFSHLKKYADFAMYQAKKHKDNDINHIELFNQRLLYQYHKNNITRNLTDVVLEKKQIRAVYQPIHQLNGNGIYGYEGLSRSNSLSVTGIMQLIEIAEGIGKIDELDLLMMEQVIRSFKKEGKLFINIVGKSPSAVSTYMKQMVQIASEVNISMENIVLELSERTKWDRLSIQVIVEYKEKHHFLIAVDDFGIGFSGNAILLDLQPDIVKIDRYFIDKIHEDKQKYIFLKKFIEFIKNSHMKVVCEGIEEQEELDVLMELGTDFGQGYYLGKPE